ncbi:MULTISPECIES: Crp/Fnr family transcriptional regulator [Vibrio]|uniref:Crp/Fnr family transcriptional regulator n=1 Tax=Vibrio TaxID=662 RepID=UPI0005127E73|nr:MULTISPECIES: Crp/Fnr family transcriptional regulator [Vibrio]AIS58355.1 catabolite gene activator protein [Vibrio coralliilyticus]NOI59183.1 Crp/Fnr family transcriptional regulator [Vibrio coralliilyticus]PAT66236.1 Crp/Fnr family transcriptional regulator [Vibrio coralliilyticus]QFT39650.1 Cyclic nucleotide-binding domain protein [Vibrio sp. THAF64]QGM37843.1 Cyclic nucleotide-binding domain protein [Vibrio sp. THAF191d]
MDTHSQSLLLSALSRWAPLGQTDLVHALDDITIHAHQPLENLFCSGDVVLDVHFVLDGIGRYFYLDEQGNERNKSLVTTGGAFASLSSLVEASPSPFFAQTLTPCTTASIRYERLVALSRIHPNWAEFLRMLLERLVLKKERREAGFLLLNAKQRYQQFLHEFGHDSDRIPLRHVAMYIGVTDVTLSRIRREMGLT